MSTAWALFYILVGLVVGALGVMGLYNLAEALA